MYFLITLFFLFSIYAITAFSHNTVTASSTEINYQGKLMNGSGAAVTNGDYNIELKIYDAPTGGTLLWTETRTGANKVTVNSGLFNILLGSVTSLSGVDFDQDLYLTVNVGGTGSPSWDGEMSPRKKIASVPRAFVSDTAKGLDSVYATSTNLVSINATSTNFNVINNVASTTVTNSLRINTLNGLLLGTNGFVTSVSTSSLGLLTTNVVEGSNLYFTNQRADDRIAVASTTIRNMLSSGSASLTYTPGTGVFSIAAGYEIPLIASTTEWASKVSSQWANVSGGINYAGGNLGIGSTTPSAKISVTGTAGTADILNIASSTNASLFKVLSTGAMSFANQTGTIGQVLLSQGSGSSPIWVATSSLGISGGGSLSGGTNGFVTRWTGASSASSGVLLDNGIVSGVNATSSTVLFNIQGVGSLNPFNIASSTGTSLLSVTASGKVQIGTGSGSASPSVFVLDTKNTSGDPVGVNGSMYYNSNSNQMRCFVNSAWTNCQSGSPAGNDGAVQFNDAGAMSASDNFSWEKVTNTLYVEGRSTSTYALTAKSISANWSGIAMSANGQVQTAVVSGGQIYVSINSGNTWTARDSSRTWSSVAMSATGQIQTATVNGGQIYVSTDSGSTWTAKDSSRAWSSVAMSADGSIQTAVVNSGLIYVSTDSGNTWTSKDSSRSWQAVAMSADGSIQTATVSSGQIYVSTDSGNTWTAKDSSRDWRSVDMSSDGSIQAATVNNGQIYVSTDSGDTWTAKDSSRSWLTVSVSSDGTKQVAIAFGAQVYVSIDSGDTWTAKDSSRNWSGLAMSGDGSGIAATVTSGFIYVSNRTFYDTLQITNGGVASVSISSNGVITLYDASGMEPTPVADGVHIFARSIAGRLIPRWMGPSGVDTPVQPALFSNSISMWLPGSGATVSVAFGTTWTARNAGTGAAQAHPALASTNYYTSMIRATFTTGTTATGSSGIQSAVATVFRGNATGLGGFFYFSRIGVDSTYINDVRLMNGLSAHNAALNAQPSTLNNSILLGKDSTDTTWQIMTRNGTTVTKFNTGHTISPSTVFDFYVFARPNDSKVTVRLVEQTATGTVVIVDNREISDTLPVNTTFLYAHHQIQATTGTTGKIFSLNRIYIESDL